MNMVSWQDYAGVDGFYGASSPNELQSLNKALSAGSSINAPGAAVPGDGFAMRVESLERTLKSTTFRAEHIRLWRAIPKLPAYNTVEEFNQIQSYGQSLGGGWIPEAGLPNETDAQYERKYSIVKFMGVSRRVSHVMTLVKPAHGNVIAQETVAGTLHLLQMIENNLFFGDSSLDPLQWDGFERQIEAGAPAGNIIDLRGQPLTEEALIDASLTIMDAPNYGRGTHLHLNPKVKADLVKTFFPKMRYDLGALQNGKIGGDVSSYISPAGDVRLESNVFLTDGGGVSGLAALGDAAQRPAAPSISVAAAAAPTASSQFVASDNGNYFYWVVAVNRFGQSAPVQVNAVTLAVVAGDGVSFTILPGAGPLPSYYQIYRTRAGGAASTARLIRRVSNIVGGAPSAAALAFVDLNQRLPGCTTGFLFQQDLENMAFKQLAPMIKIPLATVDPSIRWMQLIYGTPQVYTPGRNIIFRNIGRAADAVNV
jgi:hypothetical protein